MTVAKVYAAITAVTASISRLGIAKRHVNSEEGYAFRGIDDVYAALSPLLAEHRLCMLPRVQERASCDRLDSVGNPLIGVSLRVAFDLVSAEDGSSHIIETCGEALDSGDKATSKAMTAAFKQAVFQTFCVPVAGNADADAKTPRLGALRREAPPEGWDLWSNEVVSVIACCETVEALDRVKERHRATLHSAKRERPDIYATIGEAMVGRGRVIAPKPAAERPPKPRSRRVKKRISEAANA